MSDPIVALTHPDDIALYRLLTLKAALKLETLGMSRSGVSVYSLVKREFGFKGSKARVHEQLCAHIDDVKRTLSTPTVQE